MMDNTTHATDEVLVTTGLTKLYGTAAAVDSVSVTLRRGRIYGLIGRNGAGKTTLMRLVTGLVQPTSGTISLFGSGSAPQEHRQRIGSLIESPGLNGAMTARQNLHHHRIVRGVPDAAVETELLELVGLEGTGRKKVRDFSLGMRQRLGIATSLVSSPELLILDEPVNGLDPTGVVEIRRLVRELAAERDLTVLISSHNLPELYQTASDYIIIEAGAVKRTLTLPELDAECSRYLSISAPDPNCLVTVVEEAVGTSDFTVMPDRSLRLHSRYDDTESVLRTLVDNDVWPTSFTTEGETLESFFLSTVGGETP